VAETANGANVVDVGRIIDEGRWSGYQKAALVVAALAVILDGFDNQILSLAIPVLVKVWGVTRDDFKWVLVVGFAGMAIGTGVLGTLGDKIGRRPMLIACVLLFSVVTIAISFVNSIPPLYLLRFLGGVGLGGAMPNATALLAELTPARRRSIGVTCGIVGIPVGGTIGGFVAAELLPVYGWQSLFLVGGVLPLVVAAVMFFMLPESPRYLVKRADRKADLVKVLGRMGYTVDPAATFIDTGEKKVEKASVDALLSTEYRRDTLGLWGAMFFTLLSVYGVVNWLPAMLGEAKYAASMTSTGLMVFNLGGVVTALLGALCFSKFGSRATLMTMAAGAVVSSVVLASMPLDPAVDSTPLLITLAFQGGFLNGCQTTLYALGAYIYVTELRGTGVGWAVGLGRLGAIISPLVGAALLKDLGPKGFFFGIAATMVLSFLSLALIRRHVPKTA
jgi:MFS transporter, AAHS family, 4-hydroxybenzoate transporter